MARVPVVKSFVLSSDLWGHRVVYYVENGKTMDDEKVLSWTRAVRLKRLGVKFSELAETKFYERRENDRKASKRS